MVMPATYQQSQTSISMHPQHRRSTTSRSMFFAELSQCLFDFVIQLLPTAEEMAVKEDVRKLLEKLIKTIEPDSRLLSFGSTANGFSLRNSDMDLCCLIDSKGPPLQASDLVTVLGDLLERETKFHVKTLPFARIPIVKLSLDPSPGLPFGISCDIGFENRLALENTRLLLSYASIDPTRVRTIVLFLKVWTKRRKINSPYRGTLSSYGYVLLVIYFLVHVKNPPVLPNLQQMPPLRPISHEDMHIGEHNIWFFDDTELLRRKWQSSNTETVAELLVDFFKYYSRDFLYNTGVASIRAGLLKKEAKGWASEGDDPARDRNRLCIEDPFETNYNVSRTVTKDGLYTIRGEFMRASRILAARPERAIIALAQLCEEREEDLGPSPSSPQTFAHPVPRLAPLPPQVPYTVGASPRPPALGDRLSPPRRLFEPLSHGHSRNASEEVAEGRPLPQHMAPTRGKWTSPPPPDAPSAVLDSYASSLGLGLSLATSSTEARESESKSPSTSSVSESVTDEELNSSTADSQPSTPPGDTDAISNASRKVPPMLLQLGKRSTPDLSRVESPKLTPKPGQQTHQRGRPVERTDSNTSTGTVTNRSGDAGQSTSVESSRRSTSGPPALRSPPLPGPRVTAVPDTKPYKTKTPSLTLDTNYFPTITSSATSIRPSPISTASPSQIRSPWTYSSQSSANASGASHPYRHHQHSASTSSQYPASVTIYRTQPQATTFPLYQQAPSNYASTSSSPVRSPDRMPRIHYSAGQKSLSGADDSDSTSKATSSTSTSYSAAVVARSRSRTSSSVNSSTTGGGAAIATTITRPSSKSSSSVTSPSQKGGSSPVAGVSRNPSVSRASYDPSAAFRIPTSTVHSPSPPERLKSRSGAGPPRSGTGSGPGSGTSSPAFASGEREREREHERSSPVRSGTCEPSPASASVSSPSSASSGTYPRANGTNEPLLMWPVVSMGSGR